MGLREVKSELNKLDNETLIKHISELYKKYKSVKEYFDFYINPNESENIGWGFHDYLGDVYYKHYE